MHCLICLSSPYVNKKHQWEAFVSADLLHSSSNGTSVAYLQAAANMWSPLCMFLQHQSVTMTPQRIYKEVWFWTGSRDNDTKSLPKARFSCLVSPLCFTSPQSRTRLNEANGQVLTCGWWQGDDKCSCWVGGCHGNPQQNLCLSLLVSDGEIIDCGKPTSTCR